MIKLLLFLFTCILSFPCLAGPSQTKVKVACMGNSVTYGAGIKDREQNAYPAQLQKLVGGSYQVGNFGFSGATLLRKGHRPYHKTQAYHDAIALKPDIAIIHLGLNDTDPRNWRPGPDRCRRQQVTVFK
jgi:sialate O-acetylesterase